MSEDVVTQLARFTLLRRVDEPGLRRLAEDCTHRRLVRGEVLFHRGTPCHGCYGVLSGMMQLSVTNRAGVEKVVEMIGPDETFGEAVMFIGSPYPVDAQALVDSELLLVPKQTVDWLLDSDQQFARALLASMASRLHTLVRDVENYTLRNASQRFAAFVLSESGGEEETITLRSAKHVLASRLGITPETLSRVMHDLTEQGVIAVEGREVAVLDRKKLRDLI